MEKAAILKRIWANGFARFAFFITVIITIFSVLNALVKGLETVSDFFDWAEWIYVRLNTPWMGLFTLITVGTILWFGIERIIKADGEREVLSANIQKQMVEIPILMAKSYVTGMEFSRFNAGIFQAEKDVLAYKERMKPWLSDDPYELPREHVITWTCVFSTIDLHQFYPNLNINLPILPQWENEPLITEPIPGPGYPMVLYKKANNGPLAASITRYIVSLDAYIAGLRKIADSKVVEIRAMENDIKTKVAHFG